MINFADVFGVKYPLRLIIDGIKRSMIKKNRKDQILMKTENEDISMLAEIDTNPVEVTKEELDQVFPVMTLRNLIMFPSVVMPVTVGRQSTLKLVNTALKKKSSIVITTQKVSEVEAPGFKDLYPVAVIGKVLRIFEMPGGNTTVILQSNGPKVNLDEITATRPYLQGKVSLIEEDMQVEKSDEMKALMDTCRELSTKYVEASERMSPDTAFAIKNLDEPEILVNFICTNFPFSQEDRYALLCINNLKDRLYRLIQVLNKEVQLATLKQNIQMRTREDLDRQQREYFLQQQIKNIQDELGNGQNDEVEELREKASHKKWRREVGETFEKEVSKLERINPQSPDYNVQLTYLQTLLALPWDVYTDDVINIPNAEKVLNKDHYGLEKVKERILEYLAVRSLTKKGTSPIICLVGPPGTGKTSIARSVAKALNKKYVRISLGGVRDEAEIRGHRKTYVGAMPGRLVEGLRQAGVANPLMLLDEIDKVSSDYKGDTSSALLEVLDGEQNVKFRDHYVELPIDLSNVLFIATANTTQTIPGPLLDRMEVIEVNSYTENEKFHIARNYLVEKQKDRCGLKKDQLVISDSALKKIIHNYTREAGVRNLERRIGEICRKTAREYLEHKKEHIRVTESNLEKYLGKEKITFEDANEEDEVGIVRGLAWTSAGGDTLQIEVNVMPGKGNLLMTGQLGDVMKESAQTALTYVRSICPEYGLADDYFEKHDLHIHIPEGAVPKDGPSAGITMATAMLSAVTGKKVLAKVAMTGEITLRGRVLPIGGLKEKILAAKMAHIKKVLVPEKNRPDIGELSKEITKGLEIVFVKNMESVVKEAFA